MAAGALRLSRRRFHIILFFQGPVAKTVSAFSWRDCVCVCEVNSPIQAHDSTCTARLFFAPMKVQGASSLYTNPPNPELKSTYRAKWCRHHTGTRTFPLAFAEAAARQGRGDQENGCEYPLAVAPVAKPAAVYMYRGILTAVIYE